MNESIWVNTKPYTRYPKLNRDIHTDVLIIGGGMAGVLCAYMLKQRDISCVLIEADRIGSGVTCNTTAKITSQHGLVYHKLLKKYGAEIARLYWQANELALQQYRSLSGTVEFEFETKDNYIYSVHTAKHLERELEALQQMKIPAGFEQKLPLPFDTVGAVRFFRQGQMNPLKLLYALADGLEIYEQTTAREFSSHYVITDECAIRADKIVVASHFPILNKHGAYFAKMYQQRSYVLALQNAEKLDGMYRDEGNSGLSLRSYGDLLLIGGGGHKTGKTAQGWEPLEKVKGAFYPKSKIISHWATQDCMTLDEIPYIGEYSKNTPNLYVATGFNKWGMTSSMVAAMILSDLVQGRHNPFSDVFSPSRSMLHPQLFVNLLNTAGNLMRPTKPRCPHLGCALQWNRHEHSWDCPCHGSRFTKSGELLDNPATDDLNL